MTPRSSEQAASRSAPSRRVRWRSWRLWGLYSRRHFITAVAALSFTGIALWWGSTLLAVSDPPASLAVFGPDIILAIVPSQQARQINLTTFDVRVVINPRGCHNPVRVELLVYLRGKSQLPRSQLVRGRGIILGEIRDATRSARNFVAGQLSTASYSSHLKGIYRPFSYVDRKFKIGPASDPRAITIQPYWVGSTKSFEGALNEWFASTSVSNGYFATDVPVMHITFDADWEFPRSYGTCYIFAPNLFSSPGTPPSLTPGNGSDTVVPIAASVTVDGAASSPPPDDARGAGGPTWTCKIPLRPSIASACSVQAVLDQPNAVLDTQFGLLITGAALALGFAVAAESLLAFNWPLKSIENRRALALPQRLWQTVMSKTRSRMNEADRIAATRRQEADKTSDLHRSRRDKDHRRALKQVSLYIPRVLSALEAHGYPDAELIIVRRRLGIREERAAWKIPAPSAPRNKGWDTPDEKNYYLLSTGELTYSGDHNKVKPADKLPRITPEEILIGLRELLRLYR